MLGEIIKLVEEIIKLVDEIIKLVYDDNYLFNYIILYVIRT